MATNAIQLTGPGKAWTSNGWTVLNNAWGAGDLVYGKDYTISSSFPSFSNMTDGTSFAWSFPTKSSVPYAKVLAYPEVGFGPAPNYNGQDPTDKGHVFPAKVSEITELTSNYNVNYGGNKAGYDVSYDIWFTNVPNGVGDNAITNEVMVWLHQGDIPAYGKLVGTYSDDNFSGKIYHAGTYTAIISDTDLTAGTVDIAAMVSKLQSLGIVKGSEYLSDIEFGAEAVLGAGNLTINHLDINLTTHNSAGVTTEKNVTGAGVTLETITGTSGKDTIVGLDVNDLIKGGAGGDKITTGDGKDKVVIAANAGHVEITDFSAGNDTIELHYNNPNIGNATAVNTTVNGVSGAMVTFGDSTIFLDNVSASSLSAKNFTFVADSSTPNYNGTFGDDAIYGGTGNDIIHAGAGNDTVLGLKGNDTLYGEDGKDSLYGGQGSDTLYGGNNDDFLSGGIGNDKLDGGAGNDTAVFVGNASDYTIVLHEDGMLEVTDKVASRDGTDALYNIEDLLFQNGLTKVSDIHEEQQTILMKGASATAISSTWKTLGYDKVMTDSTGKTTVHYNSKWEIQSADKTVVEGNKQIVTHYDANMKMTYSDISETDGNTKTVVHVAANGKVFGSDTTVVDGNIKTIKHYDGTGKFVSSEVDVTGLGKTTNTIYDANGKVTSSTVYTNLPNYGSVKESFDANNHLISKIVSTKESDGARLNQYYDSNGAFHNADKIVSALDGSSTTYHYDASWKVATYEVVKAPVDKLGDLDLHVPQDVFSHISAALASNADDIVHTPPHFG